MNDKKTKSSNNLKSDALFKSVMTEPLAAKEFLHEYLPAEIKDILNLDKISIEKDSYVELRHEVAKKSCFPHLKQERKPSLPRDDPRVLNKERA